MNKNENRPWTADGDNWAEHEGYIIGNREGFRVLREKIDQVIESGLVKTEEPDMAFMGLKVVEKNPCDEDGKAQKNEWATLCNRNFRPGRRVRTLVSRNREVERTNQIALSALSPALIRAGAGGEGSPGRG